MFRSALLVLLCFGSSVLGSALTVAVMPPQPPAEAPAPAEPSDALQAKSLTLVDDAGRVRLRLTASRPAQGPDDGVLVIYDDSGIPRWRAGLDAKTGAFLTLQNTDLPNPDHKRITLSVNDTTARADIGHGELSEIVLQSAPSGKQPSSLVSVLGRNGSEATLYTDPFGHATIEVKDMTTASIFRKPEWKPVLPDPH